MFGQTSTTLSTTAGRGPEVDIRPAPRPLVTGKEAGYLAAEFLLLSTAYAV